MYIAFEKHLHDSVTVTATTDCVACFWDLEDLNFLATRCSPAVSAYWRNFAMAQVRWVLLPGCCRCVAAAGGV